jgi:hypothetical protein
VLQVQLVWAQAGVGRGLKVREGEASCIGASRALIEPYRALVEP